ncbi:hypothetical protein D3Z60_22525 [Lachnospiraceae bacterium]|jgi:hypothetical protein|nr:hypothetical protein [Lachnospiraceae bacterium]
MQYYMQEQLEAFLKDAWSYESRDGWEAGELSTEFVGTVQQGNRFYDIYVDIAGNYWYTVRIMTQRGIFPEYEAIFGHSERERRKYRR